MEKVCLITHVADADGAFPIVLAKLVFKDLEVFSCEINEVDSVVSSVLLQEDAYKDIYIVDLCMSEEMACQINENEKLKKKIRVFDHHASRLSLNQYSFISVIDEQKGRKECGTSLFFQHLQESFSNAWLVKPCVAEMIELIRQGDTFDFTKEKEKDAFSFGSLYAIYGRERYIEHFYEYILTHEVFSFSETEEVLLSLEEEKTKRYIEEKMEHIKFATLSGFRVGIVFAEQKRSLLGHEMARNLDIDIAVVINVDRSVSYRAEKEEVDVSILSVPNGGGGHKHAGGSPLPCGLQEKICEYIFKDVHWIEYFVE